MRACRWAFYRTVNGLSDFQLSPCDGEFQLTNRKVLHAGLACQDYYPHIRGIFASRRFRQSPFFYMAYAPKGRLATQPDSTDRSGAERDFLVHSGAYAHLYSGELAFPRFDGVRFCLNAKVRIWVISVSLILGR